MTLKVTFSDDTSKNFDNFHEDGRVDVEYLIPGGYILIYEQRAEAKAPNLQPRNVTHALYRAADVKHVRMTEYP